MLSILICSMTGREASLARLLGNLEQQAHGMPVEILVETDNGTMRVGAKRNKLMARAARRYLAFIDDDDQVSPRYVELVLNAILQGQTIYPPWTDCIGMCGYIMENGARTWQFRHSVTVGNWSKDKRAHIYFRTPNHLNPIRSDLARMVQFPETNWGEDRSFSEQVRPFLHNEIWIEEPIYFYTPSGERK